jgi:hypothetical protein
VLICRPTPPQDRPIYFQNTLLLIIACHFLPAKRKAQCLINIGFRAKLKPQSTHLLKMFDYVPNVFFHRYQSTDPLSAKSFNPQFQCQQRSQAQK